MREEFVTKDRSLRRPSNPFTFGVEIHATIAAGLLEGRRIDLLGPVTETALLLVLPLVAVVVMIALPPPSRNARRNPAELAHLLSRGAGGRPRGSAGPGAYIAIRIAWYMDHPSVVAIFQ